MAVSTNYRLPGVYSTEIAGPRYSTGATTRPVIAFVGPSVGHMSASQRMTLNGVTPVALSNDGAIGASVAMTGVSTRRTYSNGTDFVVDDSDVNGVVSVSRNVVAPTPASGTATTLLSVTYERPYYPNASQFDFHDDSAYKELFTTGANPLDAAYEGGWALQGTLAVAFKPLGDESTFSDLTEGTDYIFNYRTSFFTAVTSSVESTPPLASQGTLRLTFKLTVCEPILLDGEAPWTLVNSEYVEPPATVDGVAAYGVKVYGVSGETPSLGTTYVEDADYVVDYQTGRIARAIGSSIPAGMDSTYLYAYYYHCAIQSGSSVIVAYDYTGSDYYDATWVSGYNVAQETFGRAFDQTTGEMVSPLTAAIYIAGKNGLGGCWCAAVEGATSGGVTTYSQAAWEAAIESLKSVNDIDIIVPLTGDYGIWSAVQDAVNILGSDEYQDECVAIVGPDGTESPLGVSALESLATSLNSELMWMVAPSTFQFRNPVTNVVEVLPAYYMAAAIAGYLSTVPAYTPLTHKVMSGFWGRNERHTKAEKTEMSGTGMLYVDEYGGSLRILHGRTTAQNGIILDEETNIVLAKHIIIKAMRDLYANGYIGSVINADTIMLIKSSAQATLSNMLRAGYMSELTYLDVQQDQTVPTQVNVSFEYRPAYSLNYIEITFSVDATTSAA